MISPEALEKVRAIDWTRIDDALISCAGLLKTLCRDNIGDTAASELEYARSVIAALQAERDAAAPKLPDDLAGLVERLNGVYRVPITDGFGAVGSGEEPDNPNEFVRRFETPPIQKEAAAAIQSLVARIAELRAEIAALKKEAAAFAEWVQDYSNDGHIARAARSFLNKMEGRE